MAKLPGAARRFIVTVIVGGIATGACFAALLPGADVLATSHHFTSDKLGELRDLAQRSTVYDSKGNRLAVLGVQNRQEVPLSEVPQVIINAVIATEDQTFWDNDGVDFNAVFRALIKNLTSGEIEQGGSTITQQLVKNRLLNAKRDINRKIREIVLATRLAKKYTKKEILEQYLNTVYFGQGSYGIKSAVERFFKVQDPGAPFPRDKNLNEVTLGEAALLAGVISNPEGNNPFVVPDRALARRHFVLRQMVKEGYATEEEATAAEQEPLPTIRPPAELRPGDAWAEEVQDQLFQNPVYSVLGATEKERRDRVLRGGLTIHATKDPDMQAAAEDAINSQLARATGGFTASLVAIEPTTGLVKAMVPGPGFENSQYNVATTYPGRQMGSTWKAITLAAALEAGYSPNDIVDGSSPCSFGSLGRTQNAEGSGGRQQLRNATKNSVNCAFARLELSVGFPKVIEMAHKLGITQTRIDENQVLTMTLGAIESTPLEMATVAATIANGGVKHPPLFVDKIEGPDGSIVFEAKDVPGERAMAPENAACQADIMKGTIHAGGTGSSARLNGREASGKTGTTDDKRNAAFLGYTNQLSAFVWHGNLVDNRPGAGFGGGIPAAIWKSFMDRALAGVPATPVPAGGPSCARPGAQITPLGRIAGPVLLPGDPGGPVATTTPPTVVVQPTGPRNPCIDNPTLPACTVPRNPCSVNPNLPVCPGATTAPAPPPAPPPAPSTP